MKWIFPQHVCHRYVESIIDCIISLNIFCKKIMTVITYCIIQKNDCIIVRSGHTHVSGVCNVCCNWLVWNLCHVVPHSVHVVAESCSTLWPCWSHPLYTGGWCLPPSTCADCICGSPSSRTTSSADVFFHQLVQRSTCTCGLPHLLRLLLVVLFMKQLVHY